MKISDRIARYKQAKNDIEITISKLKKLSVFIEQNENLEEKDESFTKKIMFAYDFCKITDEKYENYKQYYNDKSAVPNCNKMLYRMDYKLFCEILSGKKLFEKNIVLSDISDEFGKVTLHKVVVLADEDFDAYKTYSYNKIKKLVTDKKVFVVSSYTKRTDMNIKELEQQIASQNKSILIDDKQFLLNKIRIDYGKNYETPVGRKISALEVPNILKFSKFSDQQKNYHFYKKLYSNFDVEIVKFIKNAIPKEIDEQQDFMASYAKLLASEIKLQNYKSEQTFEEIDDYSKK